MPEPQEQCGPNESSSIVCQPSGLSLYRQMNPFRISYTHFKSPSEEVVRDCYCDLIIARLQRQREGAILNAVEPSGVLFGSDGRQLTFECPATVLFRNRYEQHRRTRSVPIYQNE